MNGLLCKFPTFFWTVIALPAKLFDYVMQILKKKKSSKYIMVITEQSYRGTHDILTGSLSLLITHHNVINLTQIINLQFLQIFPQ